MSKKSARVKKVTVISGILALIFVMFICNNRIREKEAYKVLVCPANGNDTEDDTIVLQKALDQAIGAGGTKIVIMPGRYYISETLTIYSDTILQFEKGAEIVRTNESNIMIRSEQDYGVGGYLQAGNITIDGGTWNGNVKDSTVLSPLMYFCHGNNINLKNCIICNCCSRHMVILAGIDTATISNMEFSNAVLYTGNDIQAEYYGLMNGTGQDNNEFSRRTMEALHLDCISADGSSEAYAYPCDNTTNHNIVIENCTFNGFFAGVGNHYLASQDVVGSGLIIKNNTFTDIEYTCINVYNQRDVNITGNAAVNVGEFIRVVSGSGKIYDNTVKCRRLSEPSIVGLCGIKIFSSSKLNVTENRVAGGRYGIAIYDSSEVQVDGNHLENSRVGILINHSQVNVTGNIIKNIDKKGIWVIDRSEANILANYITHVGLQGIHLYQSYGDVTDNHIASTRDKGIYIYGAMNTSVMLQRVSRNEILHAGNRGIQVEASSYVSITDNHIVNSFRQAIRCTNKCSYINIERNIVIDNKVRGSLWNRKDKK